MNFAIENQNMNRKDHSNKSIIELEAIIIINKRYNLGIIVILIFGRIFILRAYISV